MIVISLWSYCLCDQEQGQIWHWGKWCSLRNHLWHQWSQEEGGAAAFQALCNVGERMMATPSKRCCWPWIATMHWVVTEYSVTADINIVLFSFFPRFLNYISLRNLLNSFNSRLRKTMRKATHPLSGMDSSNPCWRRGEWLHHHGDGLWEVVCTFCAVLFGPRNLLYVEKYQNITLR